MSNKVLQFTDLHLKDYPFDEVDLKTLSLIKKLVDEEQPELVIFTGDIVWGTVIENPLRTFEAFIEFCNTLPTRISLTYGNHDVVNGEIKRELFRELEKGLNLPVNKKHIFLIDNRENYCIELEESKVPIIVMDSGGYQNSEISKYDYLLKEQLDWFDQMLLHYSTAQMILAFQHIPIIEYMKAYQENLPHNYASEIRVDAPGLNTGFFSRLVEAEQEITLSVGHNHENNFQTKFLGVNLTFGQLTGFSPITNIKRGARKFIIDQFGIESRCIY